QLAVAEVRALHQFERIDAAHALDRFLAAAKKRPEQITETQNEKLAPAKRLPTIELRAQVPTLDVELGAITAAAIDVADIEKRVEAERHLDAIAVLDRQSEGGRAAHGGTD